MAILYCDRAHAARGTCSQLSLYTESEITRPCPTFHCLHTYCQRWNVGTWKQDYSFSTQCESTYDHSLQV